MLVLTILMMLIGFAAISTTLIINGSVKVGENTDDFSVIFTSTSLDGTDVYKNVISEDKKIITFTTSELKTLNQTSILTYEVTNNSSNYDAEVTINCKVKDDATAKYTSIKNELENNATVVKAKETLNGTLTVTLNKTSTEEVKEEYVCELTFNAVERDTLGGYNGVKEWTFDYTDGEQIFTIPVTGTYKLETWGASGGDNLSYKGGYGGYSSGTIKLSITDKIFINIGGKGLIDKIVDNVSTPGVGGGGGFYGGNSQQSIGGSGGSGYIGNTLLTDKSMYCYNCTESTEESTKTISTTCVSKTPTENCAKIGNGYAKITLIK